MATARPTWNSYFMQIADTVATRATCDRAKVGCVIVKDKQIMATGYNGSVPGAPHCDDAGHLMVDNHCLRTVHSEINAISQAAKAGANLSDTVAYVTHKPCLPCAKALVAAGVKHVYYATHYGNQEYHGALDGSGVWFDQIES